MQLPSLPVAVSASLPVAEGVAMEATVALECSSAHEMMVMENVPVNLAETVLPWGVLQRCLPWRGMLRCRSWCLIIRL